MDYTKFSIVFNMCCIIFCQSWFNCRLNLSKCNVWVHMSVWEREWESETEHKNKEHDVFKLL